MHAINVMQLPDGSCETADAFARENIIRKKSGNKKSPHNAGFFISKN